MTQEQKQEKKKPGLIKKILKYIGLSMLVLIILLALVVEAPKKLVILLLIILAAFTALPRPARKWLWFSIGALVLLLIIWIFLPEKNEGWQPYQYNFDKELQKLQIKYSIPPEKNAATMYLQLMERYDVNDYYILELVDSDSDTFDKIFRNPWRSEDYPEIADGLKHIQGVIDTLIEISEIKQCVFPISDPYSPSDKNSAIRRWARLLVIPINNDIAEGRIDEAIQKFAAILQMARHQYQQPTLIDVLNGQGVESLALLQINRFIVESEAIDEHLNIIEKALLDTQNDWNSIYANTLEYDKLRSATELTYYYEINTKGRTRLSRDPWAQLRSNFSEFLQDTEIDDSETKATLEHIAYPSYLQKKLIKAETILRWFIMPSDPEKAASILYTCLDNYDFMAEPDFDWKKQQEPVSANRWSNFNRFRFDYKNYAKRNADKWAETNHRLHDSYLRTLTMRRGSRLLLPIKQYYNEHGAWPPDLNVIKSAASAEAFIDPVTENPLEYKNHGERFSLYGETANIWPK